MPVRDTADIKLIIRITDAEHMRDQAKRFMNKRLMPDNNDGDIWVLQSPTVVEIAALKSLGFEFFQKMGLLKKIALGLCGGQLNF